MSCNKRVVVARLSCTQVYKQVFRFAQETMHKLLCIRLAKVVHLPGTEVSHKASTANRKLHTI